MDYQHGMPVLLACLTIALSINALKWVVELVKDIFIKKVEKSDALADQTAADLIRINHQLNELGEVREELKDLNKKVNQVMVGIRILAGDEWPKIQRAIVEDIFNR